MNIWRFRAGFKGVLILQRCIGRDGPSEEWRDATTEDLFDYYKEWKAK